MVTDDLVELLADAEHASWARWMAYLFSRTRSGPGGTQHISCDDVTRWQRQIETSYADLSEREKESDREEVAHILPFVEAYAKARAEAAEAEATRLREDLLAYGEHRRSCSLLKHGANPCSCGLTAALCPREAADA